ncbi:MAG: hypothetical protein M3O70_21860 [Actinomycetota bacterium]|nr:hypothetical protein [Actinomycetota bacterium]
MEWLLAWLPVLGCGVMMLVCMKMMGGMGKKSDSAGAGADAHGVDDAEALRARVAELEHRLEVESGQATSRSESPWG